MRPELLVHASPEFEVANVRIGQFDVVASQPCVDPQRVGGGTMLQVVGFCTACRRSLASVAVLGSALALTACAGTEGSLETASLAPPPDTATALGQQAVGRRTDEHVTKSVLSGLAPASPQSGNAPKTDTAAGSNSGVLKKAQQLRLAGQKSQALKVLDAAENSETEAALVKQRGMLALELGQLAKAERLLIRARDDFDSDWRVHSALGATLSARGNQQAAQVEFSKALKLSPDHPSVLNNLALSYALDGNHDQAEQILRRAAAQDNGQIKSQQNLALILGLHGDVKEAQRVSRLVLPQVKADENVAYFASRKMTSGKVSRADKTPAGTIQSARADTSVRPNAP